MSAAAAFGVYSLITALLFYNLLPVVTTHLYSDVGDPLLNASILAWNARHLPLTAEWWNFPSFAPLSGVTSFTEHLLGLYPLASPVVWLTGNALLAHNVVLLASFPLNGIAAYLLARDLTGSKGAAFIGGLAFAFAPYQSVHLSHIQTLTAYGMPLALLGLHRYLRTPAPSHPRLALLTFGFGWLLTALSNAYMLVFFPLLVALWCAWFIRPREWRRLAAIVGTAVVCALPLVPLLRGYELRHAAYGFSRDAGEMRAFAADVIGLLGISHREQAWRWLLPHTFEESALFPGLAIAVLALMASRRSASKSTAPGAGVRRGASLSMILGTFAAAMTLIVLARVWTGPFGWHIGPIPLPPFTPFRVFWMAVVAGVAGALTSERVRAAWARRDPVMFYLMAAVALWLLALGPLPEWSAGRLRAIPYGPYYLLAQLPGFSSVRVPARLWLLAVLCLSVLAAYGVARLPRRGRLTLAALALAIVAEGWFHDRAAVAPRPMDAGVIPVNALVLDLPIDEGFWNATPQYRAVLGGYRSINGYSGYQPPHFDGLRHQIADLVVDALTPYRRLGDLYVIVRPGTPPATWPWLLGHPGAQQLRETKDYRLVRLPALAPPPRPPVPLPLPRPGARPFGAS